MVTDMTKTAATIYRARREIELMVKYCSRLVSDAVTKRIDLRATEGLSGVPECNTQWKGT